MTDALLAYLAGCIDCDGTVLITIRNRRLADGTAVVYYVGLVGLNQVTPQVPTLLRDTFGGRLRLYQYKGREGSLPAYSWQVTNRAAAAALQQLRPFLRIKGRQADLVVKLTEIAAARPSGNRISDEDNAQRQALRDQAVALNAQGKRRFKHAAAG